MAGVRRPGRVRAADGVLADLQEREGAAAAPVLVHGRLPAGRGQAHVQGHQLDVSLLAHLQPALAARLRPRREIHRGWSLPHLLAFDLLSSCLILNDSHSISLMMSMVSANRAFMINSEKQGWTDICVSYFLESSRLHGWKVDLRRHESRRESSSDSRTVACTSAGNVIRS